MSRILVLAALFATTAFAQDDTDIPPPDGAPGDEIHADSLPDTKQPDLQTAAEDLKLFMQNIAKAKDDTGLHAEAAADDHGDEEKGEEELEDVIEFDTIDESATIELEDSEALLAGDSNN